MKSPEEQIDTLAARAAQAFGRKSLAARLYYLCWSAERKLRQAADLYVSALLTGQGVERKKQAAVEAEDEAEEILRSAP